ncbi:helix-turn-helix domain-containing protein [Sphingobacterium psychroaquaticum]|uniref:AraC family transcriptional regulator n=1 Tax=Sphingobacterium psychroaquaticum TaxID=561061 RepID=UPI00106B2771|nr:AraC family transcriptional regulator [Sphingobacterium psychroaquaticum]QBQ42673.1 helix-turn-helix domain-containing protein [Sphingobacterium psychroaquaticum]
MAAKVPTIAQCTVSLYHDRDIMVEDLSGYLARNRNLVFPHRHNFYHFLLFTKGAGYHSIDFETFQIEAGQVYFMAPGQIHSWNFEGDMEGFVVNFDPDFFKTFLLRADYLSTLSFFSGIMRDGVFVLNDSILPIAEQILENLNKEQHNKEFARASLLYLFQLLELQHKPSAYAEANVYNHLLLRNFLNLIEQHFKQLRLPKDYAELLYITPNHLNALSKEFLGIPAGEVIRNRVILEAKRLLVIKDFSISEIAYELNFNDNSYFTKFFKKIEGITPEEFRKQQQ